MTYTTTSTLQAQALSKTAYLLGSLGFVLPAALVTAYTLNLFYRTGATFWDSGLFAYFACFTDAWPMLWPDFLHRQPDEPRATFFNVHFMPIFYLTSALHKFLPIPPATYFSILQGLWPGFLGLAVFILCWRPGAAARSFAAALSTALCGPVLSAVGFPHIELAIPALLALHFGLRSVGHRIAAYVALALCFLIREDAGFQVAGPVMLLALAQAITGQSRFVVRENLVVAFTGLAYSVGVLALQFSLFPTDESQLERIYLGRPAFAHLSWELVALRVSELLIGRAYAIGPPVVVLGAGLWKRDLRLVAGALAPIPWILLSLIAVRGQGLESYYSFPLIVTVAWPSIVLGAAGVSLQLVVSVVSIMLFVICGGTNKDVAPWQSLKVPDFNAIGRYERVLKDTVAHRNELGRLMLGGAVVSLIPEAAKLDEWVWQWEMDKLPNPDAVIYMDGAKLDRDEVEKVITASALSHHCQLSGTPFILATRMETGLCR